MGGPSIRFLETDRPSLPVGAYTIEVEAFVDSPAGQKIPAQTLSTTTRRFTVAGPRFQLAPEDVAAVFPPDGTQGGYADVLPHVLLSRSTLPWQRAAQAGSDRPWLAVLSFAADEAPEPRSIALRDLAAAGVHGPSATLEVGESPDDRVAVIDVSWRLLKSLLPSYGDLPLLAHVRQPLDSAGAVDGDPVALVVGNRLPLAGHRSVVFLISLEDRYSAGHFAPASLVDGDVVRLVVLGQWAFEAGPVAQDFIALLDGVSRNVSTLQLPPLSSGGGGARALAAEGYAPLPHHLRNAEATVSFYHGPLVSGPSTAQLPLPAATADGLLVYDPQRGLFDASYAAAWQIGRLLALADRGFAARLYDFKRAYAQLRAMAGQMKRSAYLPLRGNARRMMKRADEEPALPDELDRWFVERSLLRDIPWNYLVPDESMLPLESLRFFQVDNLWIRCLLDGAFSVGRIGLVEPALPAPRHPVVTGFLLRSQVVSGWPDLIVEGEGTAAPGQADAPHALAQRRMGEDVLLYLFAGTLTSVTIHPKPEALHLGVLPKGGGLVRPLRDSGTPSKEVAVPLRAGAPRVVDIAALGTAMATMGGFTLNAATFAYQMTEGAPGIRFRGGQAR